MPQESVPFRLTDADPVIVAANGTANQWSDVWSYQVPNGVVLFIRPEHTLGTYLEDASAEVGSSTCRVKVEKRDPSGSDVLCLYGADLYLSSKEFQDRNKMAHFRVPAGGAEISERFYFVIAVYDDGAVQQAPSYFEANIEKVRRTL